MKNEQPQKRVTSLEFNLSEKSKFAFAGANRKTNGANLLKQAAEGEKAALSLLAVYLMQAMC